MNKFIFPKIKVKDAISWAGNQTILARRLGITRSAVSKWNTTREYLPEFRAMQLELMQVELMKLSDPR